MTDTLSRLQDALSDRYDIERELGRGGMAVVYLARDLKHERQVALKVLRPELAATVGAERFLREIRIAAQLNHPHILMLIDSGQVEDSLYYVMPFVEGESLREKLAKERELPISDAVRILRDVVDALALAHSHGVIHRDIKPDNVMLSGRHALVADFGVAKALSKSTGAQDVTTAGVALGTPAYMSPEQAVADEQVDHRSDIYAVGALAYELLTGRPPFLGTSPQMVLSAHVADPPEPVTKYRDTVSTPLEHLVLRCLEKKPADRWQSAEELLTQLESIATPSGGMTPTTTRPVARISTRAPASRRLVWGAVAAVLVTAVTIVVLLLLPESGPALDPNRVVVAEFRNETGDSTLDLIGRMAGDRITRGIREVGVVQVVPWETALQSWFHVQAELGVGGPVDPLNVVARETGAGVVISGTYYLDGDSVRMQADVNDAGGQGLIGSIGPVTGPRDSPSNLVGRMQRLVMGFLAVRNNERLAPTIEFAGVPPYEAYEAFIEGVERFDQARPADAQPYFRRAIDLDSGYADAYLYLADSHWSRWEFDQADTVLKAMSGIGERLTPYHQAYMQSFQANLAGDYQRSLMEAKRAAEMAPGSRAWYWYGRVCVWRNHPREAVDAFLAIDPESPPIRAFAAYWGFLANAYHMLGEHERELDVGRRFHELHPDRPRALTIQAFALAAMGDIENLRSVLDELTNTAASYEMQYALIDGVQILRANGHLDGFQEILRRAIAWMEGRPPDEKITGDFRMDYGLLLYLDGRPDEAQEVLDALVDEVHSPRGRVIAYRGLRGFVAATRGDTSQALEDEAWIANLGPLRVRGWPLEWRAVIKGALGERDEAVSLLREAMDQGLHLFQEVRGLARFEPLSGYPTFEEWLRPKG